MELRPPPRLPVYNARTAPGAAARERLAEVEQRQGSVPRLLGVLAVSEPALAAYVDLSAHFARCALDARERHVVLVTACRLNGAGYCLAAHSAIGVATGVEAELIVALRSGAVLPDPRLDVLRRFTEAAWHDPGRIEPALWTEFEAAGYGPRHALDVLLGLACKQLSNATSRLSGVELDTGFQRWSWSPGVDPAPRARREL